MPDDQYQPPPPSVQQQTPTQTDQPGRMPPPPPPPPGFPVMLPMGQPKKTFISRVKDALVLIIFFGSLLLNLMLLFITVAAGQVDTGLREKTLIDGADSQRIAVIDVNEVITDELAEQLRPQFESVIKGKNYKALLLYVNSPGGGAVASDTIAHYVEGVKQTEKPVVAFMGGVAASGGYYVSARADYIMAGPGTITGSIGVLAQLPNFHGTLQKIGAHVVVIPSTPATKKTIGSPFVPWDPANRQYIQKLVDPFHERFVEVIYQGRKKHFTSIEAVEKLADGAALTATKAKESKLIDQDGAYFEQAVDKAAQLAGLDKPKVVRIFRTPSFREMLSSRAAASSPVVNVDSSLLDKFTTPRVMYLWQGQ